MVLFKSLKKLTTRPMTIGRFLAKKDPILFTRGTSVGKNSTAQLRVNSDIYVETYIQQESNVATFIHARLKNIDIKMHRSKYASGHNQTRLLTYKTINCETVDTQPLRGAQCYISKRGIIFNFYMSANRYK